MARKLQVDSRVLQHSDQCFLRDVIEERDVSRSMVREILQIWRDLPGYKNGNVVEMPGDFDHIKDSLALQVSLVHIAYGADRMALGGLRTRGKFRGVESQRQDFDGYIGPNVQSRLSDEFRQREDMRRARQD